MGLTDLFAKQCEPEMVWDSDSQSSATLEMEKRMTTKITVDAHAGWPVEVVSLHGEPNYSKSPEIRIVKPYTTEEFYIHSGLRILSIVEQSDKWQAQETHHEN